MPDFMLTDSDARSLTTFVLSLRAGALVDPVRRRALTEDEAAIEASERILVDNNCVSCHQMGADEIAFRTKESPPGGGAPRDRWVRVAGDFSPDWQAIADGDEASWTFVPRWVGDSFVDDGRYRPLLPGVQVGVAGIDLEGKVPLVVSEIPAEPLRRVAVRSGLLPDERVADLRGAIPGADSGNVDILDMRTGRFLWTRVVERLAQDGTDIDDPEELAEALAGFDYQGYVARTSPPPLVGLGGKMDPEFLYNFIRTPRPAIRPGATVRMPLFQSGDHGLTDHQIATLVRGFAAWERAPYPFYDRSAYGAEVAAPDAMERARRAVFDERGGCRQCHTIGPVGTPQTPADRGPDLAPAGARLRPDFLLAWLRDPSLLKPGTAMPAKTEEAFGATPEEIVLFLNHLTYPSND